MGEYVQVVWTFDDITVKYNKIRAYLTLRVARLRVFILLDYIAFIFKYLWIPFQVCVMSRLSYAYPRMINQPTQTLPTWNLQ